MMNRYKTNKMSETKRLLDLSEKLKVTHHFQWLKIVVLINDIELIVYANHSNPSYRIFRDGEPGNKRFETVLQAAEYINNYG